jgi:FkbM family methyltransferase
MEVAVKAAAKLSSAAKHLVRSILARYGLAIYSTRPHGRDDCHDLAASGVTISVVFDVGANDGSSALKFAAAFPAATIHSFEPVSTTFSRLVERTAKMRSRVCVHQLALGDEQADLPIFITPHSTTDSFVNAGDAIRTELVTVTTLDAFAAPAVVIDLLKIDAEGYDLRVLRGAASLLADGRIRFILIEVGFHRDDPRHVLLDDVRDYLAPFGFVIYGIYDQQLEWSRENRLRYANVAFCHDSVLRARL